MDFMVYLLTANCQLLTIKYSRRYMNCAPHFHYALLTTHYALFSLTTLQTANCKPSTANCKLFPYQHFFDRCDIHGMEVAGFFAIVPPFFHVFI